MIVEKKGFGATLALVVTGSRANRVHIAPILFRLRMLVWIAVNLRRRGLQNLRSRTFCKAQHIDRAMHRRLGRLHWIVLVMDWRGRTGEIVDLIDLDEERERNVVA